MLLLLLSLSLGVTLLESEEVESSQDVVLATSEIQHLVLTRLSCAIAQQLVQSVICLQDTFVGTLQRCLESLEKNCCDQEGHSSASDAVKQVTVVWFLSLNVLMMW